jgi:hypothetical protein
MLTQVSLNACDVCGCSVNSYRAGLLTNFQNNTLRLGWNHSRFQQVVERGASTSDRFQLLELSLRYHVTDRLIFSGRQSYQWNRREYPEAVSQSLEGLGDAQLLISYVLLNNTNVGSSGRLYLEFGAGVKLPSGQFDDDIYRQDLPENFNIGNGSWGYLSQLNILYNLTRIGLALNAAYQINGPTAEDDYHFGDQATAGLTAFYKQAIGKNAELLPMGSIRYEFIAQDRLYNQNFAHGTGGEGLFLSAGLNFRYLSWMVGANYAQAVKQSYSGGEMKALGRIGLDLTYTF